jgi:PIN domain nuclease of toxin-antitoxin system
MRLLLDTHLVVFASLGMDRLPPLAQQLMRDPEMELVVSAVCLWEVAIKAGLRKHNFPVRAGALRQHLRDNGYLELAITGGHAIAVAGLPPIHKDPFDRLLLAQALVEDITLLTVDARLAQYPVPVRLV